MTALPTLRPATTDDVEAVAELWHRGWHDGHAGHVPAGLTAARTYAAFLDRVPPLVPATTVAVVPAGRGLVPNPDLPAPQAAVRDHSVDEGTTGDRDERRGQEVASEAGAAGAPWVGGLECTLCGSWPSSAQAQTGTSTATKKSSKQPQTKNLPRCSRANQMAGKPCYGG